jgi:LysR family glycine cleavage system transcriptional activator
MTQRNRLPPLNALRAFDATARHRTVAKAADELAVTASAVSHQLRTLEEALGVALFARHKARLKLTPQGEALWPAVRSAFQTIASAAARIGDATMAGELAVSVPVALTSRWLTRYIGEFLRAHPDVKLRIIASNDDKEVYSSKVDVCVRYGTGIWPDRMVTLLSHVNIFPVCSPAMINGPTGIRDVADLQGHQLLCEDNGTEWTRWLLAAGAGAHACRLTEMGNAHVAIEAALHGQGIALADSLLVQGDLQEGRLVRLFDVSIAAKHAYYIVHRHEVDEMPVAGEFIGWMQESIRRG